MPIEQLWGATQSPFMMLPDRSLSGYLVLFIYSISLGATLYFWRPMLRRLSRRQWLGVAGLCLAALTLSQLFPINVTPRQLLPLLGEVENPTITLTVFAALPALVAAAFLNPAAALIVGLFSGLGQALWQTHQLFDPFHFALAAALTATWMHQSYRGRLFDWLRRPFVAGPAGALIMAPLLAIANYVYVETGFSALSAADFALSAGLAMAWPHVLEGLLAGLAVWLLGEYWPGTRRPARRLVTPPYQRSLSRRLLINFLIFALILTLASLVVVSRLAVSVATRLVVNQMAHDTATVVEALPGFRALRENLLVQYAGDDSLLSPDTADRTAALSRLYRTGSYYRRLILVDETGAIISFFPLNDAGDLQLTQAELVFVADALAGEATLISPGQTVGPDEGAYALSFVVPVRGGADRPAAALIGRLNELSLRPLIAGLDGIVGRGSGFITDELGQIIAHREPRRLLEPWEPPAADEVRWIPVDAGPGQAFEGRQSDSNARELVYYAPDPVLQWTVIATVPYEVVLKLGLDIGWPLFALLFVATLVFSVRQYQFGRELSRPMKALVGSARAISGGALNTPIPYLGEDEVGELSTAFEQMRRATKRRLDDLNLLLNINRNLTHRLDHKQSMPAILQSAIRATGAAGARGLVLTGRRPRTFGEGPAAAAMAAFDRQLRDLLRYQAEPLILSSPVQIRQQLGPEAVERLPIKAIVGLPLRSRQRLLGVLWLGFRQPHQPDEQERNVLRTLAGQAAVLIENVHLLTTAEGGRRRLAAVLASASDAIIVTDSANRVLLVNSAFERAFNLRAADIVNRPVASVLPMPALIKALTSRGGRARSLEIPLSDDRTLYANVSTVVNQDGSTAGRVGVLSDITYLKELDALKSQIVQDVVHDLRNPLTALRGNATTVELAGPLNQKQVAVIEAITRTVDKMAHLVENVLDLGKIEAGLDKNIGPVRLERVLGDMVLEYGEAAAQNGLQLRVDAEAGLPVIYAEEPLLRQALANLLQNAIKYAPNSGDLVLRAVQEEDEVLISLRDRGPGIAPRDLPRIFERFYKVKTRANMNLVGSGVGLAIVKSVAQRHGGRAWVESQVGKGSIFTISLPIRAPNGAPRRTAS